MYINVHVWFEQGQEPVRSTNEAVHNESYFLTTQLSIVESKMHMHLPVTKQQIQCFTALICDFKTGIKMIRVTPFVSFEKLI